MVEARLSLANLRGRMTSRTIVIGGGLAGLAAAQHLAARGRAVELFEGSSALGGVVGTVERGGFLFERAPHTILAGSPTFRRVVDELGLSSRLERADPTAKTRWLWSRGKLRALSARPSQIVTTDLLSWSAKRRVLSEPFRRFFPPLDGDPEPSFGAFLDERIGREASRLLAGAFVRGIHAAELDELGARSAFPSLWALAARHGSILRGVAARAFAEREPLPGPEFPRNALVSFPRGLRELVDAFGAQLGERARCGARAVSLELLGERWLVRMDDGRGHVADDVIVATSAPIAAELLASAARAGRLRSKHDASRTLGRSLSRELDDAIAPLRDVRHASVTLVGLGFAASARATLPDGFGYLVPPIEDGRATPAPRALGTIFVTNLFPHRAPHGACSIASFYRGADVEGLDDPALARLAEQDLALAIAAPVSRASVVHVERWNDVIPRHSPGHADRVGRLRTALRAHARGLHVAGAWVDGVSVENVLSSGRSAADRVLEDAGERT